MMLLERRVNDLEASSRPGRGPIAGFQAIDASGRGFDELPSSLIRTLRAMQELGEADATAVSQKTERNRSVETIYLNQLVRLGALTRSRAGKRVLFRLAKVY